MPPAEIENVYREPWQGFRYRSAIVARLRRSTRRTPRRLLLRWTVFVVLALWLPTAALSLASGPETWTGFLRDLGAQARLLLSVPLLLALERGVGDVVRHDLRRFTAMVEADARPRCRRIIRGARTLLESWAIEATLLLAAYVVIFLSGPGGIGHGGAEWEVRSGGGLSAAGLFHVAVVLPLYFFLCFRWVFRYGVWVGVLARARGLKLRLVATHPDHVGGLAFVGGTQIWFALVFMALEWVAAGRAASAVLWRGATLADFAPSLAMLVFAAGALFLTPPLLFTPALWRMRFHRMTRFGTFAAQTARAFERRWMPDEIPPDEELRDVLTSRDISALRDLHAAFDSVKRTSWLPMTGKHCLRVLTVTIAPAALPIAASVPLTEVFERVIEMVF